MNYHKKKITPVLLAGGSGTRLWPVSRKSYPKQFSNLMGEKTLFQQSAIRLMPSSSISFEPLLTITNSDFRFIVAEQLEEIEVDTGTILIEPIAKNTAPAILTASLFAYKKNPNAILLVAPSDHSIPDISSFHASVGIGVDQVEQGKFVTFGISPQRPETAYGYLKISNGNIDGHGTSNVANFVEKPDAELAKELIESSKYLWNSGIYLFKASDMISAFEMHGKKMLKLTKAAVESVYSDLGFLRLNSDHWSELENISIDYAIMEKVNNLVAVPLKSKWSDMGGWDAIWLESEKDKDRVVLSGGAHAIDCSDTLLRSESPNQQIVGLGLENIVAVATHDAVLIAQKNRSQEVKKIVNYLREKNIPQSDIFPKDFRPWGWFESLVLADTFQVKRIFVKPGAALSLQSHRFRSEHWIVVEGRAKVTVDGGITTLNEGQSVYVPLGSVHRLENPSEKPMVLIEVQTGTYLGEDDIVRYEDLYARVEK